MQPKIIEDGCRVNMLTVTRNNLAFWYDSSKLQNHHQKWVTCGPTAGEIVFYIFGEKITCIVNKMSRRITGLVLSYWSVLGQQNHKVQRPTSKVLTPVQKEHVILLMECWAAMTWWRHRMETLSALLAICAGNSPVPGEFPTQRSVTRSFDVFFDMRLNKRLSKQSWGWWF